MLRKWFMCVLTLFWWSSSLIIFTKGENILFLNLFKDEESSENIDSNLERDLISAYNFDEDDESIVFKKNALNNTDPELLDHKSQHNDLEDEQVKSTTLNMTLSLKTSQVTQVSDDKTAPIHSKRTPNENSHFNFYSKAPVEDETSVSETPVEGGLYSFVRLCFDIIASLIQGVMRGITSVGDIVTNSKPDVSTDYSQSSTSRIFKRGISSVGVQDSIESSAVQSKEIDTTQVYKEDPSVSDLKTNLHLQHKDYANIQNQKTNIINTLDSVKTLADLENNKNNKVQNSSTQMVNESLVSSSISKGISELKKKDMDTEKKPNEAISDTTTSIPNSHSQEENVGTNTKNEHQDLVTPLAKSTTKEHSSAFLLNDFINKQSDPKLKEIIQKQFATAQLYPQPHEGEYQLNEETSTATIMMATGGVLVVLVLVSFVGLAAAYKFGLIKSDFGIGRNRFGNRNSSSQRTTMA